MLSLRFPSLLALPAVLFLTHCVEFEPPYWDPQYGPMPPPWQEESLSFRPPPRHSSPQPQTSHATSARRTNTPSRSTSSDRSRPSMPMDGIVTESYSGNRTHRDRSTGAIVGSEWTSPAGNTTYRDSSGSITGSSDESPSGTRTYRDSSGSIALTSSTTPGTGGDSTTTYRRNGTIVGTKYISPAGNTTWRDGSGSIISGPSEMKP